MGILRTGRLGSRTGLDARQDVIGGGFPGQFPSTDQKFSQGAAEKGTGDKAEGCRCHRDGSGAGKAHLLKERSKTTGSAVPAAHRNGTGGHTQKRAEAHSLRNSHRDKVLRDNENGDQQDHLEKRPAALPQHLHIALKTNGGEKDHHAQVFDGSVERAFHTEGI